MTDEIFFLWIQMSLTLPAVPNTVIIMWLYEPSCIYLLWNNFQLFAINLYKLSVILFIFNVHRIIPFDPLTSRNHVQFLMLNGRQECSWFTIMWCVWGKLIDSLALSGISMGLIFFGGGGVGCWWGAVKCLRNVSRYERNMLWNSFKRPKCYVSC